LLFRTRGRAMRRRSILWAALFVAALVPTGVLAGPCLNPPSDGSAICIDNIGADFPQGTSPSPANPNIEPNVTLRVHWELIPSANPDFYQVRFSETESTDGGTSQVQAFLVQDKTSGGEQGAAQITRPYMPGLKGPPYLIQVQYCFNVTLSPASCGPWATVSYTPPSYANQTFCGSGWIAQPCPPPPQPPPLNVDPSKRVPSGVKALPPGVISLPGGASPGGQSRHPLKPGGLAETQSSARLVSTNAKCAQGYVLRQAYVGDAVCVAPQTRAQAQTDNGAAAQHETRDGRCVGGYVWRAAGPQDHVCVSPQTRGEAAQDNAAAPNHATDR